MTEQKRDIQDDLAMCERATPGPWKEMDQGWFGRPDCAKIVSYELEGTFQSITYIASTFAGASQADNARFIAEARTALPYWIERAQAAEAEAERLRKEHHIDRIEMNRRIMKLETENARVVAMAGAGYEKLIAALRWYADKENYDLKEIRAGGFYAAVSPVSGDGGQRARELLKELGTE